MFAGYEIVSIFALAKKLSRRYFKTQDILRDGAVVARRAHNPKVIGSSPVPATKFT